MKKLVLLILIFITNNSVAQNSKLLFQADSLFEKKKYIDAKNIYEKLFFVEQTYSNKMLLKMSFIEEGLENYEKVLLFLSYHYNETFDDETQRKINTIAEKNELSGFEQNDMVYFKNLYKKNKNAIYILLLLIISIFLITNMKVHYSKKIFAMQNSFLFFLLCVFTLFILNFNFLKKEGIISSENTFIMNGPSSGSDIYEVLKKGSKVLILDEKNIWYELHRNGKKKYVRKKNVYVINN